MFAQATFQWLGLVGYGATAVLYLAMALMLLARGARTLQAAALVLAVATTALWAGLIAYGYWNLRLPVIAFQLFDGLKLLGWLAFLWLLATPKPRAALLLLGLAAGAFVAFETVLGPAGLLGATDSFLFTSMAIRILLGVLGLAAIENLYRNLSHDERWQVKFFCIGLGGLFVYDIILYANLMAGEEAGWILFHTKGVIHLLVLPLLVISANRSELWRRNLRLSHQGAFYSTALVAGGVYLLVMSGVAMFLRQTGGVWGLALQLLVLFGGLTALLLVLLSGRARARLKHFLAAHFFEHKYDYRSEWLRFMKTMSERDEEVPLEERVIRSIADIVESPAGALWRREGGQFAITAAWNLAPPSLSLAEVQPLIDFQAGAGEVVRIDGRDVAPGTAAVEIPESLRAIPGAWIVVPLMHAERLHGLLLLARPRAPRSLGREDYDLLRTVGQQAGSYLAEKQAADELAETREFERFNRQAAYVIHDIKNLVSQLSLLASNVEKHGDKVAFRRDLNETIHGISGRMQDIVGRLNRDKGAPAAGGQVLVGDLLDHLPGLAPAGKVEVQLVAADRDFALTGDAQRLRSILAHILDNAVQAAGATGAVRLRFYGDAERGVFEVSDDGPGMDAAFIRDRLFKPFRSTKKGGLGIGLYQSREYARELGGQIEVVSSPGAGTTVRIALPGRGPLQAGAALRAGGQ